MFIPYHRPYMTDDEVNAAAETIRNGWLTMGQKTIDFEARFASYLGAQNAVAVNSGTAALHLALCAIGLKAGDEVIVPGLTFVADANVVRMIGAVPVFADCVSAYDLNSDVDDIARKITEKTKAIVPVHYAGVGCEMDEIMAIAKKHHLLVVEHYRGEAGHLVEDVEEPPFPRLVRVRLHPSPLPLPCSGRGAQRLTRAVSTLSTFSSSSLRSIGLTQYSSAPRLMASRAVSTVG